MRSHLKGSDSRAAKRRSLPSLAQVGLMPAVPQAQNHLLPRSYETASAVGSLSLRARTERVPRRWSARGRSAASHDTRAAETAKTPARRSPPIQASTRRRSHGLRAAQPAELILSRYRQSRSAWAYRASRPSPKLTCSRDDLAKPASTRGGPPGCRILLAERQSSDVLAVEVGAPAAATEWQRRNAASPRRCGTGSPLARIAPAARTTP